MSAFCVTCVLSCPRFVFGCPPKVNAHANECHTNLFETLLGRPSEAVRGRGGVGRTWLLYMSVDCLLPSSS